MSQIQPNKLGIGLREQLESSNIQRYTSTGLNRESIEKYLTEIFYEEQRINIIQQILTDELSIDYKEPEINSYSMILNKSRKVGRSYTNSFNINLPKK